MKCAHIIISKCNKMIGSNPFRLFCSLDNFLAQLVHVQSLHSSKAAIDTFNEWSAHGSQLISPTVNIWLFGVRKCFEALQWNIPKSDISVGDPLILDEWLSIEYYDMGSVCLVSLIGQWAHHLDAIILVDLHRRMGTGFSMILLSWQTIVSPQMRRSHGLLVYLNVFNKSSALPRHVSYMSNKVRGCIGRGLRRQLCLGPLRIC